ncbi:hypothetical protein LTR10_011837 [Elasticomyces elasticus]|uniref:Uncharacterized protein n=1 Tax=Elasticomyces elasticus TaxID=574655 RepID=A0AAN7WE05_9PEZI|nr:hypothetical protein LTR10_011837 [Elasticomyces elasticus]KAK4968782.1 hypothetical protein LTR42_009059 [Elasticomyces elasticus]KAK5708461.1 hypothetical protein LTR97_001002 [Elasticomyces elasticus]
MQFYTTLLATALTMSSTAFAAPAAARLEARASTGCKPGSVAVGLGQLCQLGSGVGGSSCGGLAGELYNNDCGVIAGTTAGGSSRAAYCDATWSDGSKVECNSGDGYTPTAVYTLSAAFGNCYEQGGSCAVGPTAYFGISYCCDPI